MRLRSLLYVPADNPNFIAKAHTRGADAVVLDLEDSVLPARKVQARNRLAASIKQVGKAGAPVFVRINADVQIALMDAEAAFHGDAFGLIVSKADLEKLTALDIHLTPLETGVTPMPFIALLEDPGAVLDARQIARHDRVMGLIAGGEDIAASLGARSNADTLRVPKLLVHYAAKAEGLLSFGLLRSITDFQDTDAVARSADEAYEHGFDGATCIHPNSIDPIQRGFTPDAEEINWAKRVLAAASEMSAGAFTVDDQMVDLPVIARAERILRFADDART